MVVFDIGVINQPPVATGVTMLRLKKDGVDTHDIKKMGMV